MTNELVSGIHHTCLKCKDVEHFNKAVNFYKNILGFTVYKDFDFNGSPAAMLKCGDSILELFSDAGEILPTGIIQHFALQTKDTDALAKAVKDAGCEVTLAPQDVTIEDKTADYPVRIAFFTGPVGETIEIFQEK